MKLRQLDGITRKPNALLDYQIKKWLSEIESQGHMGVDERTGNVKVVLIVGCGVDSYILKES